MGAGNAKAVYALWGHLPHAPFRLLCYMALVTLDDDPRYYAGTEGLAVALGMHPDAGDAERRNINRAVSRSMKTLMDDKAITVTRRPAPGRYTEYTLSLSMDSAGRTTFSDVRTDDVDSRASNAVKTDVKETSKHVDTRRSASQRTTFSGIERKNEDFKDLVVTHSPPVAAPTGARSGARKRTRASAGRPLTVVDGEGQHDGPRQPALWPAPATTRCQDCQADHTGYTCTQYRNGDDMDHAARRAAR
jgi:hypothetical protein